MTGDSRIGPLWRRWLPVLVLLIAIIGQAVLMQTVNADRQAGSGFAMFSSVDFAGSRALVVQATLGDEQISVELPSVVSDDVDQLLITPTTGRANALAETLAGLGWERSNGAAQAGGEQTITAVTVTVRGLSADGRTLESHVLAEGFAP